MTGHEPERYADTNSIARETVRAHRAADVGPAAGAQAIGRAGGAGIFRIFVCPLNRNVGSDPIQT
jgi:hypothetical protein